jgi:hypothetical protein
MDSKLVLIGLAFALLILTYINTIKDEKEYFASKTIPEFDGKSFGIHNKACKAAMDTCKDPFCINFKTGKGPLIDCAMEYKKFFTKKGGLIPPY